MKKISYILSTLIAIIILIYSLPNLLIPLAQNPLSLLSANLYVIANYIKVIIALLVVILFWRIFTNRLLPSKVLNVFNVLYIIFGIWDVVQILIRKNEVARGILCSDALGKMCNEGGLFSNLGLFTSVLAMPITLLLIILLIIGLHKSFKKQSSYN